MGPFSHRDETLTDSAKLSTHHLDVIWDRSAVDMPAGEEARAEDEAGKKETEGPGGILGSAPPDKADEGGRDYDLQLRVHLKSPSGSTEEVEISVNNYSPEEADLLFKLRRAQERRRRSQERLDERNKERNSATEALL